MRRRIFLPLLGALTLALPTVSVSAQGPVPGLSLTYVAPTGTTNQHDPVPVMMQLMLDPSASPFVFDNSILGFGLDPSFIPTTGSLFSDGSAATFDHFTSVFLNIGVGCDATFFGGCGGGDIPYSLANGDLGGAPSLSLNPGDAMTFLFAKFLPNPGPVPVGLYKMFYAEVDAEFVGVDAGNNPMVGFTILAKTCVDCTFSRQVLPDAPVTSTPEPSTIALLGTGIGMIGFARRRRSR